MSSTLVVRQYVATSKEARQPLIDSLAKVAQSSHEAAGVLKYAITIPRDESDDRSVFVIEEYANQSAHDSHTLSKATQDFLRGISENKLLDSPPDVSSVHITSSYSRLEVLEHKDPYILIASFEYKENTRAGALSGWQNVTSACQQTEDGTFVYVVGKDPKNALRVGSLAVYDSEKYFWEVHATGRGVVDNKAKYSDIRTKTQLSYFKIVAGFLYKQSGRTTYSKL